MTIDKHSFTGLNEDEIFHRLFAPLSPHTVQAKGRDCKSCHNDPVALGYGRGELSYKIVNGTGTWDFMPRFALLQQDSLPEDAWTGFLKERNDISATREWMRPFSIPEQQKILTVGACLTCHSDDSEVMMRSLDDFPKILKEVSSDCVLPDWH